MKIVQSVERVRFLAMSGTEHGTEEEAVLASFHFVQNRLNQLERCLARVANIRRELNRPCVGNDKRNEATIRASQRHNMAEAHAEYVRLWGETLPFLDEINAAFAREPQFKGKIDA